MTVSELYKSVARLGFEASLEDNDGFVYAANRALLQVNSIRPATSSCVINHRVLENKIIGASFEPIISTGELCFEAYDVKSYFFEVDGNCTIYVERYDESTAIWVKIGMKSLSSTGAFITYRGFIKDGESFVSGRVRLRFVGEYLYSVKCVAMYEYLYSASESDIPAYEAYIGYDISLIVPDFLSLGSEPIQQDAGYRFVNSDYVVENGKILLLPRTAEGLYKIVYKRIPRPIEDKGDMLEDNTKIDLDEELCSILPMLIAAYVWTDDEPDKAEYYLTLYRERAADVERRSFERAPVPIINSNGW